MNIPKLKGKMTECGKNYKDCARAINKSPQTLCAKINGRSSFNLDEMDLLSDYLGLSTEEKVQIFLS